MRFNLSVVTRFTLVFACAALFVGCASLGGGGEKNPFVGTWDLKVVSGLGDFPQQLVINDDLTGAVTTESLGVALIIENVAVEGNNVSFDIVFEIEGQELPAEFDGTIDGDSISGEYVTDLGNGSVTGTRM